MRWSACSASPPPTRTTPSAPCGRVFGSQKRRKSSQASAGAPLRLRVGINTGEALVRLGVEPGFRRRLPRRGCDQHRRRACNRPLPRWVWPSGLSTYEATAPVFDYEELRPAQVKGKAEPVRVFHAKAAHGRLGADLIRTPDTAYIGREIDLALLKGLFDKTVAANSVQLVTVVGEPGIGKSRIVAELFGTSTQAVAPGLTWRQGRCLPYGDGVTFWALGEIVKAHAGILESDDPEAASAKLEQRCSPRGWTATGSASGCSRWSASRHILRRPSGRSCSPPGAVPRAHRRADPTVLVFEDLHWADDGDARVPRAPGRSRRGRPAAHRRHGPPGAVRAPPVFAAGLRNVEPDQPRAAHPTRRPRVSSPRCWTRP